MKQERETSYITVKPTKNHIMNTNSKSRGSGVLQW